MSGLNNVFLHDYIEILRNINREYKLQLQEARHEIEDLKWENLVYRKKMQDFQAILNKNVYNNILV